VSPERLVHHELCFGCGRTNLFGLLMEIEPLAEGRVHGRGFVKQDHQGAERGSAHEGVILAALSEAMAFACGSDARAIRVELDIQGSVLVGSFLDIVAEAREATPEGVAAEATAQVEDRTVARARGLYRSPQPSEG
jgi:acyl-coenzyme A thioesterase PaaI-like protein